MEATLLILHACMQHVCCLKPYIICTDGDLLICARRVEGTPPRRVSDDRVPVLARREWEDVDVSDDGELWAEMREFWSDGEMDNQDARSGMSTVPQPLDQQRSE